MKHIVKLAESEPIHVLSIGKREIIMKIILLFALIVGCKSIYAQHFSFITEEIYVEFNYQIKEQQINVNVLLNNTTKSSIYIPVLSDTSLYFFTLQEKVYSNFGIINSLLGPPNLAGKVLLKEVKGGDSISFEVIVLYKEDYIDEYIVTFDYIKAVDIKKRKAEVDINSIIISSINYTKNCKSFSFASNLSQKE